MGDGDPVTVVVRDRAALRGLAASAEAPSPAARARVVRIRLEDGPGVTPRPAPDWPPLVGVRSRRLDDGSWLVVLRFRSPAPVRRVLAEVARQAVPGDTTGNAGLWTAAAAPADDDEVPADVLLADAGSPADPDEPAEPAEPAEPPVHPVLGRAPVVLAAAAGPDALGPLDERSFNPAGFPAVATGPARDLPAGRALSLALVADLRGAAAVPVTWPAHADPDLARTVAGLAMAGVPLTAPVTPAWAADLLGAGVVSGLAAPIDEGHPLAREEHSIVLRRAALDTFSTASWRRRTAARAGVRVARESTVSVVLATRRPEMVGFALAQVGRQRGVALELVLAPHGFDLDEREARAALGDGVRLVLRPQPADVAFGDVLHAAALAASGDLVLKMDDDDWYSPDAVADLLRAHAYSGAEVVGMPAELHYLTEPDVTVARGHTSEVYARFVAGGTLMIERALLREAGGFRSVRKYVDAQLLAAVAAAGATVYRTHGLGYLLRRNATGHTWQVDLDYLLDPARVAHRWEGFRPSRLLESPVLGSQP